ncbi:MAG TPA: TetR/AcrR family transcriptional regulator [Candidatus Binataceae bacterium]|nr:TetR/AcrR family transcriptional regulator [Candidatus Binataceae bacterium]
MTRTRQPFSFPPRGSVRDRRAQRTRREIVRAGLKVFAAKGFDAATMDDIALELDATKGLLYYHFKTKEEILRAILRQSPIVGELESGLMATSEMPLAQAMRVAIHGSLALLEEHRDFIRFLHVQALLSQEEAEVVYREVIDRLAALVEKGIDQHKETGEVRADTEPRHWARMLVTLVSSYFLELQVFEKSRKPDPEYLEYLANTMVNSITSERPHPAKE